MATERDETMKPELMESAARARSARLTNRLRALGSESNGFKWTAPTRRLYSARRCLDRFAAWLHFEPKAPKLAGFYARSGNYSAARISADAMQSR